MQIMSCLNLVPSNDVIVYSLVLSNDVIVYSHSLPFSLRNRPNL